MRSLCVSLYSTPLLCSKFLFDCEWTSPRKKQGMKNQLNLMSFDMITGWLNDRLLRFFLFLTPVLVPHLHTHIHVRSMIRLIDGLLSPALFLTSLTSLTHTLLLREIDEFHTSMWLMHCIAWCNVKKKNKRESGFVSFVPHECKRVRSDEYDRTLQQHTIIGVKRGGLRLHLKL